MSVRIRQRVSSAHRLGEYPRRATDAFAAAAEAFAEQVIPKHFTDAGAGEYNYEQRDSGYEGRKVKAFGHRRPLEFTGETRRRALSANIRRLGHTKRTVGGAQIVLDLPVYITGNPRRLREIEATSPRDEALIASEVDRALTNELQGDAPAKEI